MEYILVYLQSSQHVLFKRMCILLEERGFFLKERNVFLGFISCKKFKKRMLRSFKERKRTMRSERKRTQCPTLLISTKPIMLIAHTLDVTKFVNDLI